MFIVIIEREAVGLNVPLEKSENLLKNSLVDI